MSSPSLEKMSRRILILVVIVGMLSTVIALLRWFVIDDPNLLPPTVASYIKQETLTLGHRLTGLIIELLPLAAALYTLARLYQICTAYCRGEVFSKGIGTIYRKFGNGLILLAMANGLYTSMLIAAFSLFSEKSELVISLGLSNADLYLLVVGFAVRMLSSVMNEAYRIKYENSQIV